MDYTKIFDQTNNNIVVNDPTPESKQVIKPKQTQTSIDYNKLFDEGQGISTLLGSEHQLFSRDYTDQLKGQTYKFDLYEGQNWDFIRANNQKILDQLANTLVGGVGSGVITAAEGFSNVFDQLSNFISESDQYEKSAITNLLNESKEGLLNAMPIYRKNPNKVFDWRDSGFYFELLRGVIDSAIGFSIPGIAYAGAVGKLGSALGRAELMGRRLDVLTRAVGGSNFAQNLGMSTAAALSNFNEGTVLALEVYDQEYERSRQALVEQKMSIEGFRNESEISSEEIKKIEELAKKNATDAADSTRKLNMLMMGSNFLQLRGTLNLKNAIIGGQSSARNLIQKPSVKQFWKDQALGAPVEALEEIAQNVMGLESQFDAQKRLQNLGVLLDEDQITSLEDDLGKRLIQFATSDEALLEGLMGLISGPFQYAITRAPFNKAQTEAQNKRFASQQAIIGANEEFIRKDLSQSLKAEDLAARFEEFRDKFQLDDNVDEVKAQEEFFNMIENNSFDILATKNFFTGTTENLEKQLQSVGEDPNATAEEKASAEKLLGRLSELEQRFNSFNRYEDGAKMFAKTLRLERLNEIETKLNESFPRLEARTTELLNAKIDLLNQAGVNLGDMSNHFWIEGKDSEGNTIKSPLRSMTELVTALSDPEASQNIKMSKLMTDENFFKSDTVTKFMLNRANLKALKGIKSQITISLDEDRSLDGQDLFSRMNTIINDTSTEVKDKAEALENLKKDRRFRKNSFNDLKRQIDDQIKIHNKVQTSIEQETDQETKNKIAETKEKGAAEKTQNKTQGARTKTQQEIDAAEPVTISFEDTFAAEDPTAFDDVNLSGIETAPVIEQPPVQPALQPTVPEQQTETQPQEVTIKVGQNERTYTVDPDGTVRNKDGAVIKSQSIINKVNEQLTPQTDGAVDGAIDGTTDTNIEQEVQKPVVPAEQVKNKDNVKETNNPEVLPTGEGEQDKPKEIVKKESDKKERSIQGKALKEGGSSSADTSVKLMTMHGSGDTRFKEWSKNGKSKKGDVMTLSIDLNPSEVHFNNPKSLQAIQLLNEAKNTGRELTADEKDIVYQYIPVRISHSEDPGIFTYMYNFNPKAGQSQKESEKILKKHAVNSFLTGRPATVKIKDQSPGELQFDENERMLSELPGALENPAGVNLFYTVAGTVQPVSGTRNPFVDTVMTYENADGTKDTWEGVIIMEVQTLSGQSFPLKLNSKRHNTESASLVYDLYVNLAGGKNFNDLVKTENPALYERLIEMIPSLETAYPNLRYTDAINDLVYQSSNPGHTRLNLDKGTLYIGDYVFRKQDIANNRDQIVNLIAERKAFNINVKKLGSDMNYRKHIFSSYLSSNADFENMFDSTGRLNPEGDKTERLLSGAIWVDSTTASIAPKAEAVKETKPETSFADKFKNTVITEAAEVVKDNLSEQGKEVSEVKPKPPKPKTIFDEMKENTENKKKIAEENNPCKTDGKKKFSGKFTGGKKL